MTNLPEPLRVHLETAFKKVEKHFIERNQPEMLEALEIVKNEYFHDLPRVFEDFRKHYSGVPDEDGEAAKFFQRAVIEKNPRHKWVDVDSLTETLIEDIKTAHQFYQKRSPLR